MFHHGRWETHIWFHPALNKFVHPGCSHFDDGATSKIDDVLFEQGRQQKTVLWGQVHNFKNTYASQVQGTYVRRSLQRKCFKLPTLLKNLIYLKTFKTSYFWQTCPEFVSLSSCPVTTAHVQTVRQMMISENM